MAEKLRWREEFTVRFCELISEHGLVAYNRNDGAVRIDRGLRKLMLELD